MKFIKKKKACSRLNILRMMKHNLDRNSLEKLYFGFIRPILKYGSVVWDNCTREQSDLRERPFNLKGGLWFFSNKNILIPNDAEKNILILVEEKKII